MSSCDWSLCLRCRFVSFWRFFEYVADTCRHIIGRCVRGVVSSAFGGFLNTEGFLGLGFLYTTLVPISILI